MHGFSLKPYIYGQGTSPRLVAIASRSLQQNLGPKQRITVTDGEWTLFDGAGKTTSALYYLPDDPQQERDLISVHCDMARKLHEQLIDFLEAVDTPAATVNSWRKPPC